VQNNFIIRKSLHIFGDKFSCPAKYDGVTKCRIYLAREVDKLRTVGNPASLSSDYLKYGEFLDFLKSVSSSRWAPWSE
jgi:hypothetical protein